MIVLTELTEQVSKVALAEDHEVPKAFGPSMMGFGAFPSKRSTTIVQAVVGAEQGE